MTLWHSAAAEGAWEPPATLTAHDGCGRIDHSGRDSAAFGSAGGCIF